MSNNVVHNQKKIALLIGIAFWLAAFWISLSAFLQPDALAQLETWRLVSYGIGGIISLFFIGLCVHGFVQLINDERGNPTQRS